MAASNRAPRRILVIDVGGTHVKLRVAAHGRIRKFASGPHMTPAAMTRQLRKLIEPPAYDAVSIGYPGVVFHGRIAAEPHNLGKGWVGFDFTKALGAPVRVVSGPGHRARRHTAAGWDN
jgi:predicted NBD/HSP70 family sugar kinase